MGTIPSFQRIVCRRVADLSNGSLGVRTERDSGGCLECTGTAREDAGRVLDLRLLTATLKGDGVAKLVDVTLELDAERAFVVAVRGLVGNIVPRVGKVVDAWERGVGALDVPRSDGEPALTMGYAQA